ncbi:MAG: hypothetical protein QM783_03455 [Phycisphaerales bacterium]
MVGVLCKPIRISLRRMRLVCAAAAVVACAVLGVSVFWNLHAWYITPGGDSWLIGLHDAEFVASWSSVDLHVDESDDDTSGFWFDSEEREDHRASLAWRPYHLGINSGFHMDDLYHGVAVPLWLVAMPALVGAAYLHGRAMAGQRQAD